MKSCVIIAIGSAFAWPTNSLEGSSVTINSPVNFQHWAGLNQEQADDKIKSVVKYMMNYKEDYVSFIYVTTFYPSTKFNLEKAAEGNINGMLSNVYWSNARITEKKMVIVCGVKGISYNINGLFGGKPAQSTTLAFQKGNIWYIFTNTFGTANSENKITSARMLESIK